MKNYIQIFVAAALISLAVFSRVILHLPNFAALAAVGLFAGFYFRGKIAFLVPLLAVLISDLFIGFYDLGSMLFVYAAWIVPVFIGRWSLNLKVRNKFLNSILTIGSKSLMASVSFYVVSNFGVWLFAGMYEKSLFGMVQCYTFALPFFRSALMGDLLFSGVLFGTFYLVQAFASDKKQPQPVYLDK
ncbi:MAG: DUF6580 family putative transport protein [Cyclobacteriaceae bacterium]